MATNQNQASRTPQRRLAIRSDAWSPRDDLASVYRSGHEPDLREVIQRRGIEDDDALADLVDADGRLRLEQGLKISLDRYLSMIPRLRARRCALDTAIDMTLRSMSGESRPTTDALLELASEYPELSEAIATAGVLGGVICSTEGIRESLAAKPGQLPRDFGPPFRGDRLRYELRELVGTGSHGSVYLACDRQLSDRDRPAYVAIKVLNAVQEGAEAEARLIDEAAKARRIDHANVVRVLDRGKTESGEQYLVYEYVRGGDLAVLKTNEAGAMCQRRAAEIVAAIASGLQAAHAAGVAHCDLKPGNILIGEGGIPKITDFGIAVRVGEREDQRAYARLGNLAFTAPEQFRREAGCASPLADVYAAGGILYWLLTGAYPNGDCPEEIDRNLRGSTLRHEPPDPGTIVTIDPDLAAICRKALEPNPRDRYQSAEALANDLRLWLGFSPLSWRPYTPGRRLSLFARREPRTAAAVGLVIAVLAFATGAGVYLQQRAQQGVLLVQLEAAKEVADSDRRRLRDAQVATSSLIKVMKSVRTEEEYVPVLTALETMAGPVFFAEGEEAPDIWTPRAEMVRRLLDEAKAKGKETDLEAMVWATVYGYWQIKLNNLGEAERVLLENRAHIATRLPGDSWISSVDALLACVAAKQAMQNHTDGRQSALSKAAERIEAMPGEGMSLKAGNLVRRLVLTTKAELYGLDGLNSPTRCEEAKKELRRLK
jgi:hypothetical protein